MSRGVSEGAEKFYQLCSVFWKVAEAYVHVKNRELRNLQHESGTMALGPQSELPQTMVGDFDEYLSALGLAPQPYHMDADDMSSSEFPVQREMSTYLQDWYSGNASLYGLLEQDLSNISGFDVDQYSSL